MENNISLALSFDLKQKATEEDINKLKETVESVKEYGFKNIYVCGLQKDLEVFESEGVTILFDESKSNNVQSKINTIFKSVDDEYLVIGEHTDKFGDMLVSTIRQYLTTYGEDYDVYIPLTVRTNHESKMIDMVNTLGWSATLYQQVDAGHQELGIVNNQVYEAAPYLTLNGLTIKRETYLQVGGLKESFEMCYSEEFFKRILHKDYQIVTLNYMGCQHILNISDFDQEKVEYWLGKAEKEYYFEQDRELV